MELSATPQDMAQAGCSYIPRKSEADQLPLTAPAEPCVEFLILAKTIIKDVHHSPRQSASVLILLEVADPSPIMKSEIDLRVEVDLLSQI